MPMSPSYTLRNKRVWVAGDRGLVGSALVRRLQREGCEIVTAPRDQVDLRRPDQTEQWMAAAKPHPLTLAAQSAWEPPDANFTLELALEGPADGLGVSVVVHRAVTSRTALTQSLTGRALGAVEARLTVPATDLTANAAGNRVLLLGVQGTGSATAPPDPGRIVPGRSGDFVLIPKPNWIIRVAGTTHGTLNSYDQRVPVILFGNRIRAGRYDGAASPADLAPTFLQLVGAKLPRGQGRVLTEAIR